MNRSDSYDRRFRKTAAGTARAVLALIAAAIISGCYNSKEITGSVSRSTTGSLMVKMQSGTYQIKTGDVVELSVLGYPEFQTSATVKESGAMLVPLVGEVRVAGLTQQQVIDTLRRKLVEFVKGQPEITIGISSPASQKICVLGAVTRQDNYPVVGELTVLEALSCAGGTTPESDLKHVRIIHNGNTNDFTEVDLSSYLELGNREAVSKVQAGDVIYVPRKENVVRDFSDFLRDAVFLFGTFRLFY
jgi:polysaccharide export outer membrane protein